MPKESRQPCRYEYITRCLLLVLGEMRWRFSFRVASFSSAFVLTMVMMRFLMRKARIFCWGEKEREKGERDRCEGWMTVQTHKT